MPHRRTMFLGAVITIALGAGGFGVRSAFAQAPAVTCARTADTSTPAAPTAGHPCWTDVTPYPFGADGNPVDPSSPLCAASSAYGPNWNGDFSGGVNGNPPCYLRVTSMAFRATNRGLAATTAPLLDNPFTGTEAFGVWLYNGTSWFPDPTFPGSSACPGSTLLWAGKLDYWLIGGSSDRARQTLCRFDGVNLAWEELALPQATLARLPQEPSTGSAVGGVTAGGCYAWNDCWFFGSDGIQVRWDGQTLSDASGADPATSPWLRGDFTAAVARTDLTGRPFALAVTRSSYTVPNATSPPLEHQPDGSPPPQLFGSSGGPFAPLPFSPPATAQPGDPYTTDLVAVDADTSGHAWVAGDPPIPARLGESEQGWPAPLLRLAENGTPVQCGGYGANTFTYTSTGSQPNGSYQWTSLSVFPDSGNALAGVEYAQDGVSEPLYNLSKNLQPAIVGAGCSQPASVTRFQIRDPYYSDQATAPSIPADLGGFTSAVAANAANDGWAATTNGDLPRPTAGATVPAYTKPHLYRYTDGQPSTAPLGDDNEPRPSLFTIEPPVFVTAPPTVVSPVTTTTTTQPSKPKTVKLKPAIYGIHSKLSHGRNGRFILIFEFSIRRPVTIGVQALRRKQVVASSGLRRFTGRHGQLALTLDRKRWPTRVRFIEPKTPKA